MKAKKVVDINCKLGVSDCLVLLKILNDLTKEINNHLSKNITGSYVNLASKIKMEVDMNMSKDGDSIISDKKFIEMIEEIMK